MRELMLFFAAGAMGGLINSLTVWFFGHYGVTADFGVAIAPALTPNWLYPRIVWGGLWGLLFILPFMRGSLFSKGLILSLFPTLVQLLVVFPLKAHKGYFGLELGVLTPLFVLLFNAVWGLAAAATLKLSR